MYELSVFSQSQSNIRLNECLRFKSFSIKKILFCLENQRDQNGWGITTTTHCKTRTQYKNFQSMKNEHIRGGICEPKITFSK